MLIEALQMGDLEQFRMLLDEARYEEGRKSLEDGQFTALRHAIRGREIEVYVAKEGCVLVGFSAVSIQFRLESCTYEAEFRGRYLRPQYRTCGLETRLNEFMTDALEIRGLSLPAGF